VPRSLGIPPLSDGPFTEALTLQPIQGASINEITNEEAAEDREGVNPLAGMGLTNEQYGILQNLMNNDASRGADGLGVLISGNEKRLLLGNSNDERESKKRRRFEDGS
jgi:hypothetical protein